MADPGSLVLILQNIHIYNPLVSPQILLPPLQKALSTEHYEEAQRLRDKAAAGLVIFWININIELLYLRVSEIEIHITGNLMYHRNVQCR